MPAALAVLALIALKVAASAWALHAGFTQVSDDDYARVTLAEAWAHAPRLDPSGTSWLPFPFWLNGLTMALFGRTLAVARGVALASSVTGALLVHRALRAAGCGLMAATVGVAVAMTLPWSTWLGVATVPEALTACLIVASALSLAAEPPRERLLGGAMLAIACLSRYEAWPVAAAFALLSAWRARRAPVLARRTELAAAALAVVGPVAWLAWNLDAHGDALHFLARVAAYRARIRAGGTPEASPLAALALYPEAFVRGGAWAAVLGALGLPGLLVDRELRGRWAPMLLAMAGLVAFLVEGDLHDGAPTHHPERALLSVFWAATLFGIDGLRSLVVKLAWGRPGREACVVAVSVAATLACMSFWPSRIADYPGRSATEERATQLAEGERLRAQRVAHVTLAPCAYEHFALIAAFGAPERVTIGAPLAPPEVESGAPCPRVTEVTAAGP